MVSLIDVPFVLPVAEGIWGAADAPTCLSEIPFINGACFSQLISKAVGVGMIAASSMTKTPIMRNMINSQSAAGISLGSLYGETVVYANFAFYSFLSGHPFTAYGENVMLLIQNVILIILAWDFSSKTGAPVHLQEKITIGLSFGLYSVGALKLLPEGYLYLLMSMVWPIMLYARGSQVYATYCDKHTGNLSIVTTSMSLIGSAIRILTSLQETGDMVSVFCFLFTFLLSLMMFIQYWYYLENTNRLVKETDGAKKDL
mmetsp:Transcript_8698/g.18189  ORF Transcript_8698/g.18189 Transcript_8698/m.18189 type:complete len:258 (-) Transcript_8698:494-1267(-)|eukprot:CAMPEP_0201116086 /NCGR_PEP_ID=MMETSP0850-20130426/461_1 /ASSEMBLY_ACC=CAM_ASM_000622 /TAXON_ID=183588 /ORGANISM="Pseudo-nitzschia fraudulenta, Strain WWA7" /LENGTH=257 /DNA_ID=CAMNT_0047380075 /DNA_START=61 /DNA_END=834 /DNA_ORIENTATION=+